MCRSSYRAGGRTMTVMCVPGSQTIYTHRESLLLTVPTYCARTAPFPVAPFTAYRAFTFDCYPLALFPRPLQLRVYRAAHVIYTY